MNVTAFSGRIVIPVQGQPDLPWDYFVLQAARGSVRIPELVLLALVPAVAARLGIPEDQVEGPQVDRALAMLPKTPDFLVERLARLMEFAAPLPNDQPRLAAGSAVGAGRDTVVQQDLLHDALLAIRQRYGAEHFLVCMDQIEGDDWDAVSALAAMIYLLLVRWG